MEFILDSSFPTMLNKVDPNHLLEGVCAGEHEALDPDMSRFEHDGVSSSSLPDRRLASSTE